MSESFDPYKKWLGISPKDQPPHYYRLLGLEPFESDPDVIATAADSRMALVKNFQTGPYSAVSQRLLNEIAAARVGLLNPEKKAQYDEALRQRLKPAVKQAAPPARKTAAGPGNGGAGDVDLAAIRTVTVTSKDAQAAALVSSIARRGQKPAWKTPVAIGAGVLVLAVVTLIVALSRGGGTTVGQQPDDVSEQPATPRQKTGKTEQSRSPEPNNGSKTPAAKTPEIKTPENKTPENKTPEAKTPEPKTGDNPPDPLPKEAPKVPSNPDPNRTLAALLDPPADDPPAKEAIPAKSPPEPKPDGPPAAKKLAVPDDAALQQAKKRVWDVYGKEVSAAKTAKEKSAICDKLLKQGNEEKGDLAVRYALFATARDVAAEALDPDRALAAVDAISASFDLDGLSMKADLLEELGKAIRGRPGPSELEFLRQIIVAVLNLADSAIAGDDFQAAGRLLKAGAAAARKTGDQQVIRDLTIVRENDLKKLKAQYATAVAAIDALAENPDDADASLKAGRWYCFQKHEWRKGLPLLVKSGESKLSALAVQDLAGPKTAAEQVQLADAWWELADKDPAAKAAIQSRAAHWYEEALPGLAGFDKTRVEKKLEAWATAADGSQPKSRGIVQPGNVALASNGTTVAGVQTGAEFLLDGRIDNFDMNKGYAQGLWPCEWTITFAKLYRLQAICFLLHDLDKIRFYRYRILVSADGKKFTELVDRSQGQWSGWQRLVFPPAPVRAVKLMGLYNSAASNPGFHVVEFEAYCVPPGAARK